MKKLVSSAKFFSTCAMDFCWRGHGLAPWRFTLVATAWRPASRRPRPGAVEAHAGRSRAPTLPLYCARAKLRLWKIIGRGHQLAWWSFTVAAHRASATVGEATSLPGGASPCQLPERESGSLHWTSQWHQREAPAL